jgi:hypothetical protein
MLTFSQELFKEGRRTVLKRDKAIEEVNFAYLLITLGFVTFILEKIG